MRSKLFSERPKTIKTSDHRWVRILPAVNGAYRVYDLHSEAVIGRILFDAADNWIYDGVLLTLADQEEVAGAITGHQKEMDQLLKSL